MLKKGKLLVLSQVFIPDPASVGQHMADVSIEMIKRKWTVCVLTADRGYDDPTAKYAKQEEIKGVKVQRFPFSSFGKTSISLRLLAGGIFILQATIKGLLMRRPSLILVSTSPPMCSLAALVISRFRKVPIKYWAMDLNPDQMIEMGLIGERSLPAVIFNWLNRITLRRASSVITLDHFMANRLNRKLDIANKISIIPPWPHQECLNSIPHKDNPFRKKHGLERKFVFMYSGNHSYANPIRTLLDAALEMQNISQIVFVFVGGGVGKKEIDELIKANNPSNIISLPYQPLSEIKYSLSAADVHLVSVGNEVVGIVHPCKVYGAMALARPILLLGPETCHVSDIINEHDIGWHIKHGDVNGAKETIQQIFDMPRDLLMEKGMKAKKLADNKFNKEKLLAEFCNVLELGS